MNILTVADIESKALWDYYHLNKLEKIDLIISCGDLDADYLSFLTTMYHCDVLYVPGNHDTDYQKNPPEGCICMDDELIVYQGIRILGLGGSIDYSHGAYQYTESQMKWRIKKLWMQIQRHHGFDILVTHAPAKGINDGEDLPHQGFQCFTDLIEKYNPLYFIHGHVHMNYAMDIPRVTMHKQTIVVNAYEKFMFEYMNDIKGRCSK